MQHVIDPGHACSTRGSSRTGHAFDGSSVRGFQQIQESRHGAGARTPTTAYLDPFRSPQTLVLHCFVADPVTGERYCRDPRYVARKAEEHLFSTGLADTAYFGPEPEFFIFDDVRFETQPNGAFYEVDSVEGAVEHRRATRARTSATSPAPRRATSRPRRWTTTWTCARRWPPTLQQVGIATELHHHEVASGGQGEIGIRFDTLLRMADKLMTFKYVLKNVAWQAGKSLTFMPKPIFDDNGSGMHTHQSLWKGGEPLFFDEAGYAGLSDLGPLVHRRAARTTPTRCSRSPTRPPTASSGWCRATRRR